MFSFCFSVRQYQQLHEDDTLPVPADVCLLNHVESIAQFHTKMAVSFVFSVLHQIIIEIFVSLAIFFVGFACRFQSLKPILAAPEASSKFVIFISIALFRISF